MKKPLSAASQGRRDETCALLSKINIPTLIICGRKDKIRPIAQAEFLQKGIENSRSGNAVEFTLVGLGEKIYCMFIDISPNVVASRRAVAIAGMYVEADVERSLRQPLRRSP